MTTPLTLTQRWLFVAVAAALAGGLAVVLQPSGLAQSDNDLVRATLGKASPRSSSSAPMRAPPARR